MLSTSLQPSTRAYCVPAYLNGLFGNIIALYAVHLAGRAAPLLTLPYLARVLGETQWGILALAQALSVYVTLIIEFGFNLSATREIARAGDCVEKRSAIFSGVNGAKVVLTAPCLAIVAAFLAANNSLHDHVLLVVFAVLAGMLQGFSPIWYFQGLEQVRTAAAIDVSARLVGTAAIFAFVTEPAYAWRFFAIQCAASIIGTIIMCRTASPRVHLRVPTPEMVWRSLAMGWSMFLFRAAASLYTVGNALILGSFVAPQQVGLYAGAEKISKACFGLLGPIGEALYPRINALRTSNSTSAADLTRVSLVLGAILGCALGALLVIFAPLIIATLLGPGYEGAVPVLRVLAALPPLIAISNVLGIQWLLPMGMDRRFNATIIGAGLLNVCLATFLAPRFGTVGMATAVVCAECVVSAAFVLFALRHARSETKIRRLGPNE